MEVKSIYPIINFSDEDEIAVQYERLGADGVIMQMAMLLGYTAALIFTILRTGAISKSVFNAH